MGQKSIFRPNAAETTDSGGAGVPKLWPDVFGFQVCQYEGARTVLGLMVDFRQFHSNKIQIIIPIICKPYFGDILMYRSQFGLTMWSFLLLHYGVDLVKFLDLKHS